MNAPPIICTYDGPPMADLISYDPETGDFIWNHRTRAMFRDAKKTAHHQCAIWNARYAGKKAGRINPSTGYLEICLYGRRYGAHRLAILILTGAWPPHCVDHINGDRADNRSSNIRCVTHFQNMQNSRAHKDSSSVYTGVSWDSSRNKWIASITTNGKTIHLGRFCIEEDARDAYLAKHAELNRPIRGVV